MSIYCHNYKYDDPFQSPAPTCNNKTTQITHRPYMYNTYNVYFSKSRKQDKEVCVVKIGCFIETHHYITMETIVPASFVFNTLGQHHWRTCIKLCSISMYTCSSLDDYPSFHWFLNHISPSKIKPTCQRAQLQTFKHSEGMSCTCALSQRAMHNFNLGPICPIQTDYVICFSIWPMMRVLQSTFIQYTSRGSTA